MNKVSKAESFSYWGIYVINSISKSLHASSTVGIKVGDTIHHDHCAANGKNHSKNDLERDTHRLLP